MNRKLFSLAGVLVAVFSFTVGGDQAEARNCGRHQNRCGQQWNHCGSQNFGYSGYRQGGNCGNGCAQSGNNCGQQAGCSSFQQNDCNNIANSSCAQATTACGAPQSGIMQTGFSNDQPTPVTPASGANSVQPSRNAAPPIEPAELAAPKPGA